MPDLRPFDPATASPAELVAELARTRAQAQAVGEEFQAANEELRATNEELAAGQEELREANARLQAQAVELAATTSDLASLLASTDIAVLFLDAGHRVRRYTPAAARLIPLTPADVGRPLADLRWRFTDPDLLTDARLVFDCLVPAEREVAGEGGRHYLRQVHPHRTRDDRIDGVVVAFVDVTEQKRLEERLRDREALLREAAELTHVGGWSFDPVTLQGDWTPETARIHGLRPGEVASITDGLLRFPPGDRERIESAVQAATAHGTPYDLELDFVAADGVKKRVRAICRPVVEWGKVVRVRGSLQDVTERHELEERLRQAQKMEAFGQLAGGVAHDFNNMLQVINGYADMALERLGADDPLAELLGEVRSAGERSAALTRQLLAFARKEAVAPRVLDPSAAATGTVGMLRRLIGKDVQLATDLPAGVGPVVIDPGRLEQVLINLAVNARDAMPQGGALTITTRNEAVDPAAAAECAGAKAGPHAVLAVADTGAGMPPEVLARIFEPFFTTKEAGKGTGMGLATVYGLVKQAGGHVRVRSKVGAGSTFEVYLPWATEEPAAPGGADAPKPAHGSETVLVVEDETAVRALVRAALAGRGYAVLEAADVVDAERAAAAHPGPIDLVLSDVVMPGGGGRRAAAGVLARHPKARVLFMSGYADDALVRHGVSAAGAAFLPKPFTPAVLAAKVREVLDAPA